MIMIFISILDQVPLGPVEVGQTKEATIFYAAAGRKMKVARTNGG